MPGPKLNNRRVYPSANHQPRQKAAERIGRAQARQEISDSLTLEEKIAKLPPEPYSKQERARLLAALAKRNAPKESVKTEATKPTASESVNATKPKKYMKGSN